VLAASLLEDGDAQSELMRGEGRREGGKRQRARDRIESYRIDRSKVWSSRVEDRARTVRATSWMGRWKLALSSSTVRDLD
jgi:hypothetical protein